MSGETKDAKGASKGAKSKLKKSKGKKHLLILMDETGSMAGMEESVITGCNQFLHDFRKDKDVLVTLAWFDAHPGEDRTRFKVKSKPAKDVKDLAIGDYNPRGMTPLNDAIVDSINLLKGKVAKDDTVFIAILTDGHENASETSTEDVRKLIKKFEGDKGWGFVFLGAEINAEQSAASLGLTKTGQAFRLSKTRRGMRGTSSSVTALAGSRFAAGSGVRGQAQYLAQDAEPLYAASAGNLDNTVDDDADLDENLVQNPSSELLWTPGKKRR